MYLSTVQSGPRGRVANLMAGTALGCSLLLLGSAPALASDECGVAAPGGAVICRPAGAPYATGITYEGVTGGLTVVVQPDADVVATDAGIRLEGSGALTVVTQDATVTTTGAGAGVAAISVEGDGLVVITAGDVVATGDFLTGIRAESSGEGDDAQVVVTAETVRVTGVGATGVSAGATDGDVTVTVGSVSVEGDAAQAINASGRGEGAITIVADDISTEGEQASGISVQHWDDGDVTVIVNETLVTDGNYAPGVSAITNGSGEITVTFGEIITDGEDSNGVFADSGGGAVTITGDSVIATGGGTDRGAAVMVVQTNEPPANVDNTITIDIGSIETGTVGGESGDYGFGVYVNGVGAVNTTVESITTYGYAARGVDVYTAGDIRAETTTTETHGEFASAFRLQTQGASDIEAVFETIETRGDSAHGVDASTESGDIEITGASIDTYGDDAKGVWAQGGGDISVDVRQVMTRGDRADAIHLSGSSGSDGVISVLVDQIVTEGNASIGVRVGPQSTDVSLEAQSIGTSGNDSAGVSIMDGDDDSASAISIEEITTTGLRSAGIDIQGGGAVELDVRSIRTSRDGSVGVQIIRDQELVEPANVTLNLGSISTGGPEGGRGSHGVYVENAGLTTVVVDGGISTTGADARGIHVDGQNEGAAHITVRGLIQGRERGAHGVRVLGVEQATLRLQDVSVTGFETSGVFVDARHDGGEIDHGIIDARMGNVTANGGTAVHLAGTRSVTLQAGNISTRGDIARGLYLTAAGPIDATVANVATAGINASAIFASSEEDSLRLSAGDITTTGRISHGVRASTAGDATMTVRSVATSSDESHGVWVARARNVTLAAGTISTSGARSNAVRVEATGDVGLALDDASASGADGVAVVASGQNINLSVGVRLQGTRVGADLDATGTLTVTTRAGSSTTGEAFGLDLSSGAGTTLTNRGAISSTAGVALNVDGGAAMIINEGTITGRFDLTNANDRLTNSGTLRLRGESDFGGAADQDLLTNTGMLVFAESTTPVQARLRNLERFDNAGTINLANGAAGDVLTIDGVLNGQTGNSVRLDLDTRGASVTADRLSVGRLEGLTQVQLAVLGTGVLGDTGVTLVTSGAAQTGQEIAVTVNSGFLEYEAMFDAVSREYRVVGLVDEERAWEPTKIASGGQLQWRRGADVISARLDELSDSAALGLPRGEYAQAWVQAYGGSSEVDGQRIFDDETVDLSHDVDVAGAQMGVDILRDLGGGDLVLGGAVSHGQTELTFASNGDKADFSGWGLAAYAQWTQGPLVLGFTAKADQYELDYDWASVDLTDTADGQTVGARIDAAWRIEAGSGWRVEPRASLSWTETDLDSIEAEAGEVEFGDTVSVLGKIGVRLARGMTLSTGARFQPYAGVYAFNEFEGDNVSRIHLSSETIDVFDIAAERWGEAVLGANLAYGPVQAFVQGEASFGEIEGFTARIGARLNW